MELNTLRILIELVTFTAFVAIVAWAWSARRLEDFDSASRLPFDETDTTAP
jgi:cytochrome c oxidase cbb3-type subunit 4